MQKRKEQNPVALRFGRTLVRGQVYWVIALNAAMLLTLAWNLLRKRNILDLPVISYLTTLFFMYLVNAGIIIRVLLRVKKLDL